METYKSSWLSQNWNTFACSLLVHGLYKLGVRAYFLSPGYRNAPFIAALQALTGVYIRSCWDERAGAYEALGYAKASGEPAVLVCTSGTAGANYLPALIEAKTDQVPLLVVTADRPFELVHAGAQQVIDQRQMFGHFVKRSLDYPAPSPSMNLAAWLSYVKMLIEASLDERKGPVHINLPFAMPLDPVETSDRPTAEALKRAQTLVAELRSAPSKNTQLSMAAEVQREWVDDLRAAERGLIILGRIRGRDEQRAAAALADSLGWPCYADIMSGVKGRLESELADPSQPEMAAALLAYRPDLILFLGTRCVTGFFDTYIQKVQPKSFWVVSCEASVQDPGHLPQRRQPMLELSQLLQAWPDTPFVPSASHHEIWQVSEKLHSKDLRQTPHDFCFADVAESIVASIPTRDYGLFLGNSTAIRAFDSWCKLRGRRLPVIEANRGVNGIEGQLSTTLGLAVASGHTWTLVWGDVSAIHDLNAFLALAHAPNPIIVIVVNNSGGRIFEFLPIHAHGWVKDPLMSTPHSFQFQGIASMSGIDYLSCHGSDTFAKAYQAALSRGRSCLIECKQDELADQKFATLFRQ